VWIGAIHLGLANLRLSLQLRGEPRALAPLGWCFLLAAGVAGWQGLREPALGLGALGVLLVLGFSAPGQGVGARVLGGLKGLAGVTGAFGDVLSYLRLFALGLASASLAGAFNDLAADARSGAMGLLSATLILLVGHSLNLALAVMGGFVHGLRLNFIEFFKWGLEGEGRPFQPFRKLSSDPEEP
jgi:V/A-type H+-transporting ATPase subunit I